MVLGGSSSWKGAFLLGLEVRGIAFEVEGSYGMRAIVPNAIFEVLFLRKFAVVNLQNAKLTKSGIQQSVITQKVKCCQIHEVSG